MFIDSFFKEDLDSLSEEMIANKILMYSSIDFENVPIRVEEVLRKMGFKIGVSKTFKNDNIVAGIAYVEEKLALSKLGERFFVYRRDIDISDVRYLMALGISFYVLESKNEHYIKSLYSDMLTDIDTGRIGRVARAIIMPQKSLSMLLLSPLISKDDEAEKIAKVSKAFLVPMQTARIRMQEAGFII